jgi:acyl-CoA thioesterase YciA
MIDAVSSSSRGSAVSDLPPLASPVIRTIAMPGDTNPAGDIFGGWLMAHMDLAAGNVATRRARGRAATVAVEAMAFHRPVLVGDEVSFYGTIVGTGRTSMKIQIGRAHV